MIGELRLYVVKVSVEMEMAVVADGDFDARQMARENFGEDLEAYMQGGAIDFVPEEFRLGDKIPPGLENLIPHNDLGLDDERIAWSVKDWSEVGRRAEAPGQMDLFGGDDEPAV